MGRVTTLGGTGGSNQATPLGLPGYGSPGRGMQLDDALSPIVEQLLDSLKRTKDKKDRIEIEKILSELGVTANKRMRQDESAIRMEEGKVTHARAREDAYYDDPSPGHMLEREERGLARSSSGSSDQMGPPSMLGPDVNHLDERVLALIPDAEPGDTMGTNPQDEGTKARTNGIMSAFGRWAQGKAAIAQRIMESNDTFDKKYAVMQDLLGIDRDLQSATKEYARQLRDVLSGGSTMEAARGIIKDSNDSAKALERLTASRVSVGGLVSERFPAIREELKSLTKGATGDAAVQAAVTSSGSTAHMSRYAGDTSGGSKKVQGLMTGIDTVLSRAVPDSDVRFLVKAAVAYDSLPDDEAARVLGVQGANRIRQLVAESGGDPNNVSGDQVLRAVSKYGPNTASNIQAAMASLRNEIDVGLGAKKATDKIKAVNPATSQPVDYNRGTIAFDESEKAYWMELGHTATKIGLAVEPTVMEDYNKHIVNIRTGQAWQRNFAATGGNSVKATRATAVGKMLESLGSAVALTDRLKANKLAKPEDVAFAEKSVLQLTQAIRGDSPEIGALLDDYYNEYKGHLDQQAVKMAMEVNAREVGSARGEASGQLLPGDSEYISKLKTDKELQQKEYRSLRGDLNPLNPEGAAPKLELIDESILNNLDKVTTPTTPAAPAAPTPATSSITGRDASVQILLNGAAGQPDFRPNRYLSRLDTDRRAGIQDAINRTQSKYRQDKAAEDALAQEKDMAVSAMASQQQQQAAMDAQGGGKSKKPANSMAAPFQQGVA